MAAMQQEPQLPPSGRMRFDSFGEYKRVAKRQQQNIEEEEEELEVQGGGKRMRLQQPQDAPQMQYRNLQLDAAAGAARQRPSSAGGIATGGDAKEAATRELREFIKVGE